MLQVNTFVLCINRLDCNDLELLKLYQVLPDENASKDNYLRIIDESGEDYLYPADYFVPIGLSTASEQLIRPLFKH